MTSRANMLVVLYGTSASNLAFFCAVSCVRYRRDIDAQHRACFI